MLSIVAVVAGLVVSSPPPPSSPVPGARGSFGNTVHPSVALGGVGVDRAADLLARGKRRKTGGPPVRGGGSRHHPVTRPVRPSRPLRIRPWPLPFGPLRRRLTLRYVRRHYWPQHRSISIVPRVIVLHWTGSGSLRGAYHTFRPARLRGRREIRSGGAVNVSAHFLVSRSGRVYRLLPTTMMGRHVIGLNHCAIGIENVGDGEASPLTRAQVRANAALVRALVRRHPTIRYLVGHQETDAFRRARVLYLEKMKGYRSRKRDPGPRFMRKVRGLVRDLRLNGPPSSGATSGAGGSAGRRARRRAPGRAGRPGAASLPTG